MSTKAHQYPLQLFLQFRYADLNNDLPISIAAVPSLDWVPEFHGRVAPERLGRAIHKLHDATSLNHLNPDVFPAVNDLVRGFVEYLNGLYVEGRVALVYPRLSDGYNLWRYLRKQTESFDIVRHDPQGDPELRDAIDRERKSGTDPERINNALFMARLFRDTLKERPTLGTPHFDLQGAIRETTASPRRPAPCLRHG